VSLFDDFLRLLGTNRTRLRWKIDRLRESWTRAGKRLTAPPKPAQQFAHQLCPSCGHPAGSDEMVCTRCGTRLAGATVSKLGRGLRTLIPEGVPIASMVLLACCIGLYFVTVQQSYEAAGDDHPGGFKPVNEILMRFGAMDPLLVLREGEWWRLVTAVFLHGGVMHIAMNGYGFWVAGTTLEERFGRARVLVAFLLTGVAGYLVSAWVNYDPRTYYVTPHVGASGSVFGLMGLLVGHAIRYRGRAARELRERFVPWIIFGLLMGFLSSRVDNLAHVGGLVSGLGLGAVMADRDQARRLPSWMWNLAAVAALVVIVVCFLIAAQEPPDRWR
jgi:rhomboid protease GluP